MKTEFTLEQALQAFIELVRIPSVTGNELPAVEYLEDILDNHGVQYTRIAKEEKRPNLLAWRKVDTAGNEAKKPPLVLISHIDVVPGDEAKWSHPVFGGETHEGRIFGRGTLDTKQLTMMQLFAFLALQKEDHNRDIYFLATADEEKGSVYGMEYVKAARPDIFQNAVVLNEGGGFPLFINGKAYMMLTVGEKAVCKVRLWATGQGGHASSPGDDQAMLKLAKGMQQVFAAEGDMHFGSHAVQARMRTILGTDTLDNPTAVQIYGYAGQNSLGMRNYTIGERSNVLPAKAEAVLDCKVLPGTSATEVLAFVQEKLAGTAVQCEVVGYEPGFEANLAGGEYQQAESLLTAACQTAGLACEVLPMLALGRTDGRFFGSEGSRVYGCSPVLLEDGFDKTLPKVHGNDESISEESFLFGCRVVQSVLRSACVEGPITAKGEGRAAAGEQDG